MAASNEKKQKYTSGYDPAQDQTYQAALGKLEAARENKPVWQDTYGQQAGQLYNALQNRKDFSYDINTDALYQQYRDQYIRQGRQAMENTLGSAQAMTGGYGNSYAQTAAQQSYNTQLGKLRELTPQLYTQARQRHQAQTEQLQQRYQLAQAQRQQEYDRHRDALDAYRKDLASLQTQADQAYDRGYQSYLQGYQMTQDNHSRLLYLMEKLGYRPTREELLAAGFTEEQARAFV